MKSHIKVTFLPVAKVSMSWQAPPLVSLVSVGPFVMNVSKSSLKLQTAENKDNISRYMVVLSYRSLIVNLNETYMKNTLQW